MGKPGRTRSLSTSGRIRRIPRRKRQVKIGIDVGGTFTHAVAVDAATLALLGSSMVPTTHAAHEGVARGVVESMHALLRKERISPREVLLVAHSTTQATNALLEGDVAKVGVLGMGGGGNRWRAENQTRIGNIELSPGSYLRTVHRFIDTTAGVDDDQIRRKVSELLGDGAEVIVASEAFGVDDPVNEQRVIALAREAGLQATAASDISRLYGLRVRTRTAAINASMMPTMLATADRTEAAIRESGIHAPVMIMRSDGGIMDIEGMRRRPILTMLSGPAAGVAAALMYAKISDGIFLEVGGTSTDISLIRNGRPIVRAASVGGHRLHVRTLDIRTVGIGGGSMPRLRGKTVVDVGPRSAHIAGLRYPSFADGDAGLHLRTISPRPGDPQEYVAFAEEGSSTPVFGFTTTDAANVLGSATGYSRATGNRIAQAASSLSAALRTSAGTVAQKILSIAGEKVARAVRDLLEEHRMTGEGLSLIGGGGGAEVIVPHVASRFGVESSTTPNAEVISAIGVALGMIQETIERSVLSPSEADLLRIRGEAIASVVRMGATPESVEVHVEVDAKQKRLIATARGVPELAFREGRGVAARPEECEEAARRVFGPGAGEIRRDGGTEFLAVYSAPVAKRRWFGLLTRRRRPHCVVDREGIVRLRIANATFRATTVRECAAEAGRLIDAHTYYGDAGPLQPDLFLLLGGRIIDLSGLADRDQTLVLLRAELEQHHGDEPALAVVSLQ